MFITKEKYDALVAERDAVKQELETLKADVKSSEEEFVRLGSGKKAADDKAATLETEAKGLRESLQQKDEEIKTLKAENGELKKLPAAETARAMADKEQPDVAGEKADLAVSDDKSFAENLKAVKEKYL